jgi:myo-inositol-1(or 4)-monophosphatase
MIKFLEKLARGSGKILLEYLNKTNKISIKKGLGYVGDADLASENYIISQIEKHFPESKIIAEEKGILNSKMNLNNLTWIIDPLDGTTNYIHGFPFFCVSIGVLENNKLIAGVVYDPVKNELFSAELNKGAFLNKKKISVSKIKSFKDSLLITGFYYHQGDKLKKQIDQFRKVQEITQSVRRLGAAALDICYVACGRAEGFWENGIKPWDVAGGTLVLLESGGKFTDFNGKNGNIFGKEFVYTNSLIHKDLLKVIKN